MAERPNLLYIHSDQHSPAVLGCYGDPLVQTPHLDGLAAQGVLFDNVYCPSPVCVASRMAMLAGRHPHQIECWTNHDILDSAVPTLAHAMGAGGYRPVLIGRMHARGPDQLHGYAERLVGDHSGNYSQGAAPGNALNLLRDAGSGQSSYQVHDEDVAAAAVDFFNRLGVRRRAGLDEQAFSLSVGFMLPHLPFVARRQDYELYRDKITAPKHPQAFSDDLHPFIQWWRRYAGWDEASAEQILNARAAYWALVTRLDLLIGQILRPCAPTIWPTIRSLSTPRTTANKSASTAYGPNAPSTKLR
jgi:choline-sulfatase